MKRSFLMSALVLALGSTMAMTACGGGGGSGEPAKDGESASKDEGSSGDPVADMQKISDDIQKDVDALLQPIKDVDAIIDSITKIPADLKAAKSKADGKKVLAALKVVVEGKEVDIEALKLDEAGKGIVVERHDKLKALFKNLGEIDQKVKDLVTRVTEAAPKLAASAAKSLPKLEAKLKAPFGVSAEDKKKAEEEKAKITGIVDGFKTKAAEWQKMLTEMPAKAKEIPGKFAKAFK
jgi:hypothetical protein